MRTRPLAAVLVAAVVAALLATSGCGGGGQGPEPPPSSDDPFPLAVGDRWTWEVAETHIPAFAQTRTVVGTTTVDGVLAFVVQTQGSAGETLYSRSDTAVLRLPASGADAFERAIGPRVILQLPLRVAERWTQVDRTVDTGTDFDADGRTDLAIVLAEVGVERIESVTTPAGTFGAAFVVVTTESASVIDSSSGFQHPPALTTTREWYAPGVGLVRRETQVVPSGGPSARQRLELLTSYSVVSSRP